MTITYLVRSPGTGHSIEGLFDGIAREISGQEGVTTNVIQLPCISRGLWSVWKNMRFASKLKADVFHVTGDVHYAVLALPASRTILTIHDCITLKMNRNRSLRYALFWLLWYYLPLRRAAVVTAVSDKTRQELVRYIGQVAQKTQVIPNGYDPAFVFRPKKFCHDRPVLLHMGTAPHKNLSRLIAAIDGMACTLVIVGPLTHEVITDLQHRRIDYRQYENLSRAEIVQCCVDCDIVCFVSTYEGFGMPIIEANAVGRVVITSDCSPMREVAARAAHLVDPTDAAAIRQGILRLIQDDIYRQHLIDTGLPNARRYTMPTVAAQYATLYCQLAVGQPSTIPVA